MGGCCVKMPKKTDTIIMIVVAALVVMGALWFKWGPGSRGGSAASADMPDPATASIDDYNGKRAGVMTGAWHDSVVEARLPQAEIYNFDSYTDLIQALKSNKIDFFLVTEESVAGMVKDNPEITALKEPISAMEYGAVFAKTDRGAQLKAQMDEFLRKIQDDGTLEQLSNYWANDPAAESTPIDMSDLTGANGTLRFATTGTKMPISYMVGSQIAGTDPDIAVRFCREYGYGIDVSTVTFSGIIPGITTGAYDFALSDIAITEERKESVLFSEPYRKANIMVMVRAGGVAQPQEKPSVFQSIAASFEKNFLREDRWKLIVQGAATTCLITVCSVIIGTLLGYGICQLRRADSRLAKPLCDLHVQLQQGAPIVVVLMIMYYVVFGNANIDAVIVAIIAFTLNFSAYASEIMRSSIEAVPPGQREAALALGYSESQAFHRFIFPQAAVSFLPVLLGQMIGLLKNTSIVGYIAIQDLTKMSDIIRSRTYEAFFPLIVTALIYFLLAKIVRVVMERLLVRVDPRAKKKGAKEAKAQ